MTIPSDPSRTIQNPSRRTLLLAVVGLLAWFAVAPASEALARELRLERAPTSRAMRSGSDSGPQRESDARSELWLRGILRVDRSGRVTVADQPVRITRATGIHPAPDQGGIDVDALDGREVVVMGRVVHSSVRAVLLMVKPAASISSRIWQPQDDPSIVPSQVDARVGVYEARSPR